MDATGAGSGSGTGAGAGAGAGVTGGATGRLNDGPNDGANDGAGNGRTRGTDAVNQHHFIAAAQVSEVMAVRSSPSVGFPLPPGGRAGRPPGSGAGAGGADDGHGAGLLLGSGLSEQGNSYPT
ncbi:hypothetical protein KPATCC21470_6482 [Kitasatospora purpeofusca]